MKFLILMTVSWWAVAFLVVCDRTRNSNRKPSKPFTLPRDRDALLGKDYDRMLRDIADGSPTA